MAKFATGTSRSQKGGGRGWRTKRDTITMCNARQRSARASSSGFERCDFRWGETHILPRLANLREPSNLPAGELRRKCYELPHVHREAGLRHCSITHSCHRCSVSPHQAGKVKSTKKCSGPQPAGNLMHKCYNPDQSVLRQRGFRTASTATTATAQNPLLSDQNHPSTTSLALRALYSDAPANCKVPHP